MPAKTGFKALGVIVAMLGCIAVAVFVSMRSHRAAGSENWTHQDLLAHLNGQGLNLVAREVDLDARADPAMWFGRDGYLSDVLVQKLATPREARERAGASPGGFAWGRFAFTGSPGTIDQIRKVLAQLPD